MTKTTVSFLYINGPALCGASCFMLVVHWLPSLLDTMCQVSPWSV